MTNCQAASHVSWVVKCSPRALGFGRSNQLLHTPPNPALTQSTSPLINELPFDKSNFTCPMILSPNVKPTYMLMPSSISWHSTPSPAWSPFALQTSGKLSHMVRATKSGYTKPRAHVLAPRAQHVPNYVPTLNHSPTTPFHRRTK